MVVWGWHTHPLALKCEVRRVKRRDRKQSIAHLRQHRLVLFDWLVSRDSAQGQPKRRHCGHSFQQLNGLQQHIILGACPSFDPEADTITSPMKEPITTIL